MKYKISLSFSRLLFSSFFIASLTSFAQVPRAIKEIKKSIVGAVLPRQTVNLAGDPCDEAEDIGFGQTRAGVLLSTDCNLPDGSYADFYIFNGTAGQQVTIDLTSVVFDTYLGLASIDGTFVVEDDDGGDGTNSRIIATLPSTGVYVVLANSVFPATSGDYFISLQSNPLCTVQLSPSSAEVPG
jgi:hypothetical protein